MTTRTHPYLDNPGPIAFAHRGGLDVRWDVLKNARVDGREPVPLLADILGTWSDLRVNIDCKTREAEGALISTLREFDCLDRVCVGSFSDSRLGRFRAEFGDALCTSAGPREVALLVAGSLLSIRSGDNTGPHAAQVPVRQGPLPVVTRRFVDSCHDKGMQVHVWTIDDPSEISRLLDLGVDGIMSDDIRALRDVFAARGLW